MPHPYKINPREHIEAAREEMSMVITPEIHNAAVRVAATVLRDQSDLDHATLIMKLVELMIVLAPTTQDILEAGVDAFETTS